MSAVHSRTGWRVAFYSAGGAVWRQTPQALRSRLVRWVQPAYSIGVLGLVPDASGRVLLLRHRFRVPYCWGLPGGFIELNETPHEAFCRELLEEVGLTVLAEPGLLLTELNHLTRSFTYVLKAKPIVDNPRTLNPAEILDWCWVGDGEPLPSGIHPTHSRLLARYWGGALDHDNDCWVVR